MIEAHDWGGREEPHHEESGSGDGQTAQRGNCQVVLGTPPGSPPPGLR